VDVVLVNAIANSSNPAKILGHKIQGEYILKVSSPAGDFEIAVKDAGTEGDFVVLKGQMGVWDSKIYLGPGDLWLFASFLLRPSILLFLLKLPLRFLKGSQTKVNK
jgi:hypothetical protein